MQRVVLSVLRCILLLSLCAGHLTCGSRVELNATAPQGSAFVVQHSPRITLNTKLHTAVTRSLPTAEKRGSDAHLRTEPLLEIDTGRTIPPPAGKIVDQLQVTLHKPRWSSR